MVAAIREYSDAIRDNWEGDQALICTCFGVSDKRIEQEIHQNHLTTVAEVTRACNAGAGCRSCCPLIEDILDDYERSKHLASLATAQKPGTIHEITLSDTKKRP
jgi:NifU-like protein